MVIRDLSSELSSTFQLTLAQAASETAEPLIRRLSPLNQLRVIMGLFVIIILGIFLFIVIKAGSHMVRGMAAQANRLPASSLPQEDDWADQKLNEDIHPRSEKMSNEDG